MNPTAVMVPMSARRWITVEALVEVEAVGTAAMVDMMVVMVMVAGIPEHP